LPAIHALEQRYPALSFELVARGELAPFAARRMRMAAGHSIDRREVALLFSEGGGDLSVAAGFFGKFDRIECFFASGNERFCSSLRKAARGEVRFYPFRPPGTGHIAASYLHAIGARVAPPLDSSLELAPEDLLGGEQRLRSFGLQPGRFLLILPGSGSAQKNWPAGNFAVLAERIHSVDRALVVLGPAEPSLAPVFHARALPVASDIELGELAGIARLARCFVGNDSGVSHLAAAAGARGIVIFGPTDPERWRPLGNINVIRQQPLDTLMPDQLWPEIAELLKSDNRQVGIVKHLLRR
jgi:heptosyltransferase-2